MRELISYTNRITRKRIHAIPDGAYVVNDFVDTDGFSDEPIRFTVKITIKTSTWLSILAVPIRNVSVP